MILHDIGYGATQIAGMMKDVFESTAADVTNFLSNTLGKAEGDIDAALAGANYAAADIHKALAPLVQQAQAEAAAVASQAAAAEAAVEAAAQSAAHTVQSVAQTVASGVSQAAHKIASLL